MYSLTQTDFQDWNLNKQNLNRLKLSKEIESRILINKSFPSKKIPRSYCIIPELYQTLEELN